jgi:hypothetical protein
MEVSPVWAIPRAVRGANRCPRGPEEGSMCSSSQQCMPVQSVCPMAPSPGPHEACGTNIVSRTVLGRHLQTRAALYLLCIPYPMSPARPLITPSWPLAKQAPAVLPNRLLASRRRLHHRNGMPHMEAIAQQISQLAAGSLSRFSCSTTGKSLIFFLGVIGNTPDCTTSVLQQ